MQSSIVYVSDTKIRIFLSETYSIHDYYYYDSLTVDKSRYTTVTGSPVLTYSSNGLNVNTSVASVALIRNNFLTLPSDYEAEITVTTVSSNQGRTGICFDDLLIDGSSINTVFYKLSNTSNKGNTNSVITANTIVKVRKQSGTFTVYFNDVQKWSGSISDDNHYQQFRTYQNRSTTFKDLKIKAL